MPTTDTSEKGLENLIVAALTGRDSESAPVVNTVGEETPTYGGAGYIERVAELSRHM